MTAVLGYGLDVFTAEAIAAGTEVWRFTPQLDLDLDPALRRCGGARHRRGRRTDR
ncbi:MAG TPA: hypothetical protein VFI89_09355 [Burkholderiales bacterium]|nr:hypothetical protein [Burkholderiales bacterium]